MRGCGNLGIPQLRCAERIICAGWDRSEDGAGVHPGIPRLPKTADDEGVASLFSAYVKVQVPGNCGEIITATKGAAAVYLTWLFMRRCDFMCGQCPAKFGSARSPRHCNHGRWSSVMAVSAVCLSLAARTAKSVVAFRRVAGSAVAITRRLLCSGPVPRSPGLAVAADPGLGLPMAQGTGHGVPVRPGPVRRCTRPGRRRRSPQSQA
jgi:hypothetical protein